MTPRGQGWRASHSACGCSTTSARSGSSGSSPNTRDAIPKVIAYLHQVLRGTASVRLRTHADDKAPLLRRDDREGLPIGGAQALGSDRPGRHGARNRVSACQCSVLAFASEYQLERPLTPRSARLLPGNERHGIWSAKQLMTVVPPTWAPGYPEHERKESRPGGRLPTPEGAEAKKVALRRQQPATSARALDEATTQA